jgi:hypothetical protein
MTEGGEIALKLIDDNGKVDVLPKLELFERDDVVQLSTLNNELVITRVTTPQTLTYELTDKKFVKTFSVGMKVIFGASIKLVKLDGKEKLITFDSSVIVDAQKLKEHGSKILKFNAKTIPVSIKDGKLVTNVKGTTSGFIREVEGVVSVIGSATSQYSKDLLTIFAHGIGTATIRMSEGSPMYVSFVNESMTANYLIQVKEDTN